MKALYASPARDRRRSGFSLIELMITIAILAIIGAVAFPSYQGSVRKGRRAEAFNAIAALQQAQERWRANHANYASNLNETPDANTLPNVRANTANGHYTLAISDSSGTTYIVTATAAGTQAADTSCGVIGAKLAGGTIKYGSGATSISWSDTDADAGKCWAK